MREFEEKRQADRFPMLVTTTMHRQKNAGGVVLTLALRIILAC